MIRRLIYTLLAAAVLLGIAPAQAATDYGSGVLGNWSTYSHCDTSCRGVDTSTGRYVYSDSWDTADVGIVGDSITARGWGDLYPLVTKRGHKMSVNYWSSRPTAPAVDWLLARVQAGKHIPRVLVVASGSNDIMAPATMAGQIRRLKAGLPADVTLYWVDVQVSRPAYPVADQRNSGAINQQIYGTAGYGNTIRWSELFWSAPWRIGYYLERDGVHPKVGVGTRCWAAAVVAPLISQGVV